MCDESDHRWHHRRSTELKAKAILDGGSAVLSCTVQNLSAGGAQLIISDKAKLPATFLLEASTLSLQVEARLIWSQEDQHGVTFVWPQHKEHGSARTEGKEDP